MAFSAAAESVTTPVVIVIDDIDATFVGRNTRDAKVGLRFETLLNKISGTNTRSNIILIINANDISNVDSAIAQVSDLQLDEFQLPTRPGRIDRIHYLGFMTETGRERLIKRSLVNWPEKWEELVRKTEGFTLAQVYAVCSKVCTQELKQKALNRDERV
jgi:SpoVK/Ycf46/Vps4 family AAA+-type ATPase